jgi:hypothetical protein
VEVVEAAVLRLLPQQQDSPALTWYSKVRGELLHEASPARGGCIGLLRATCRSGSFQL